MKDSKCKYSFLLKVFVNFDKQERWFAMPIKMIVTDLDQTLLRTDKTISDYTVDVFNRCRQRGIKVVFASARPKRTVKHFFDNINADAVILHNGAVTYVEDMLLHSCGIASDIKNNILLSINRDYPDATISVEINDVFYANFDVSSVWKNTQAIRTDFTDLPDDPADKIIVGVSSADDIKNLSIYLPDDLYIEMNDGKLGLIMHSGATKQSAVGIVADYFCCDMNEIVAFGDDYNDIGMLRECGVGVAMGNALDEVKVVADHICKTNDDDGVARWLDENVLYML